VDPLGSDPVKVDRGGRRVYLDLADTLIPRSSCHHLRDRREGIVVQTTQDRLFELLGVRDESPETNARRMSELLGEPVTPGHVARPEASNFVRPPDNWED
jgi:hypothetical protein